ncbi:MAG: hypothetical protein RL291_1811 [Pseudomonadota bacterium]|jgi:hypothetical protein
MTLSFSEPEVVERLRSRKVLSLIWIANIAFAVAMLLFWTSTAVFVEGPWVWGTSRSIERLSTWKSYFAYPYVLLWSLPILAVLVSKSVLRSGNQKLATFVAMTPLLIFAITCAIYYYAPVEWK